MRTVNITKVLFILLFVIAVFFAGQIKHVNAVTVPLPDVCNNNLVQKQNEVSCYSDSGAIPTCGVHSECCDPLTGCISEIAACTISKPTTIAWFTTDETDSSTSYVANCTDSASSDYITCLRDSTGKCPIGFSSATYEGYNCNIYKEKDVDNIYSDQGKWNASEQQCITCNTKKKDKVCASTSAFYLDGSGNCNGTAGSGTFQKACDNTVDATCDDQVQNYACEIGKKCDANGKCLATGTLSLGATANPTIVSKNGTSVVTFKVTASGIAQSGASVTSITQSGGASVVSTNCNNTDSNGECTATFTASTTTGVAAITSAKATKAGYADSSSFTVQVTIVNNPCSSNNCSAAVASTCDCVDEVAPAGAYCCPASTKTTSLKYVFNSSAACNNYCASCSYPGELKTSGDCNSSDAPCAVLTSNNPGVHIRDYYTDPGARPDLVLINPNRSWVESISKGTPFDGNRGDSFGDCYPSSPWTLSYKGTQCSVTINSGATCPVCSSGQCNGDQNCVSGQWANCGAGMTCSAGNCVASGPPPSISSPFCQAALIASDTGTKCGTYSVKSGDVGGFCCSVANFVFALQNDCQNFDPLCAGASACDNDNVLDVGEKCDGIELGGKTCTDLGFIGGTLSCSTTCTFVTSSCVSPTPTPLPCSGPGMFVSPLGTGYCTIGEILTNATNWILSLVASIIILIIVIGGLMYISAGGNEEKLRTSKSVIYYAMVGLGIILISYALITEVTNVLKG